MNYNNIRTMQFCIA